jgi:methyl-accepting chemotaxis protein
LTATTIRKGRRRILKIAIIEGAQMKCSSIRFKLIAGGILIVLIPLVVSGIVAKNNSAAAVTKYSKANAQSIAEGLAMQVSATLEGELKFVAAFAGRTQVKIAADAVQAKGIEEAAEAVDVIRTDLRQTFSTAQNYLRNSSFD